MNGGNEPKPDSQNLKETDDLWPSFEVPKVRTSISLIREHTGRLEKKTDGLVVVREDRREAESGHKVLHSHFSFVAPTLSGYTRGFLTVDYPLTKSYPIRIQFLPGDKLFEAGDENQLIAYLFTVFHAPETRELIAGMMYHSQH
jgi:hypothetical protein